MVKVDVEAMYRRAEEMQKFIGQKQIVGNNTHIDISYILSFSIFTILRRSMVFLGIVIRFVVSIFSL